MPCWSIHLGVCKEVNNEIELDNDLIYFGCILPDILDKKYSHYYENYTINIDGFLNDYKDRMNNPLIMGYYIHLLTDLFYNDYVDKHSFLFKDNKIQGIKLFDGKIINSDDYKYCRDFKQDDFKNYGYYLISNGLLEFPKDIDKIDNNLKELNISLDKNIIINKVNDFYNGNFYNYNSFNGYKLFDKETYDKLYKDCINYIIQNIKNIER